MRAVPDPDPDPRCGHRMELQVWALSIRIPAWSQSRRRPQWCREMAPHPGMPPPPRDQSRWPQAPTRHRGGRSICPPARSDLRKTQRQGNAPGLKGFGRTPGVTPVPSLWCDSRTRTVSSEPRGDSLGSWWTDCPAAPASGLPPPRTPGLPVVGPRAEAMGLGAWPPPARGGGQDPSSQVQRCVGLF